MSAVLNRLVEQQLVSQTHAQQRLPFGGQLDDPAPQSLLGELLQRRCERPHAWQDHAVCSLELVGIRGELRLSPHVRQRALDGTNVANPVIDDRDHPSSPLDDGTPAGPPGDIASRRARPKALNVASTMWCRLRPRITSTWIVAPR